MRKLLDQSPQNATFYCANASSYLAFIAPSSYRPFVAPMLPLIVLLLRQCFLLLRQRIKPSFYN
jgi:hypothetical protein